MEEAAFSNSSLVIFQKCPSQRLRSADENASTIEHDSDRPPSYLGRTNDVPGLYLLRIFSVSTERDTTMVRSIYKGDTNSLQQVNTFAAEVCPVVKISEEIVLVATPCVIPPAGARSWLGLLRVMVGFTAHWRFKNPNKTRTGGYRNL